MIKRVGLEQFPIVRARRLHRFQPESPRANEDRTKLIPIIGLRVALRRVRGNEDKLPAIRRRVQAPGTRTFSLRRRCLEVLSQPPRKRKFLIEKLYKVLSQVWPSASTLIPAWLKSYAT
jgi:hypothetical protein